MVMFLLCGVASNQLLPFQCKVCLDINDVYLCESNVLFTLM